MWDFRKLLVWKKSMAIAKRIYERTSSYPKEEVFWLTSQMRRSSVSISCNIAEWNDRNSSWDFKRFLQISLWSCAELETQLELSNMLGYIGESEKNILISEIEEVRKMISWLASKL